MRNLSCNQKGENPPVCFASCPFTRAFKWMGFNHIKAVLAKEGVPHSGGRIGLFAQRSCMKYSHNKKLVPLAKSLRKEMTKEERHLWYDFLSFYSVRFLRQKVLGQYITDFYCAKAKLVVELDGSQHYEDKELVYDKERTDFLDSLGIKVIRIPNNEISKNFSVVCEFIDNEVKKRLGLE